MRPLVGGPITPGPARPRVGLHKGAVLASRARLRSPSHIDRPVIERAELSLTGPHSGCRWGIRTRQAGFVREHENFKSSYHQGFGGQVTCIDAFCVPARTEHDAQAIIGQSFLLLYGRLEIPSAWGRNET